MADGFRFAIHGRYRKAIDAFRAAVETFREIGEDIVSLLGFVVDVSLTAG
jgi:hypothetical protein